MKYTPPAILLILWAFTLGAFGIEEERYFFIIQLCIFCVCFINLLAAIRKGEIRFPKTPLNKPLGLFFGLLFTTSLFFSVYPHVSQYASLKWLTYIVIIYLLAMSLKDHKTRQVFIGGVLFIGSIYVISALVLRGYFLKGFQLYSATKNIVSLTEGHNLFVGVVAMLFFLCLGTTLSLHYKYKLLVFSTLPFGLAVFLSTSRSGVGVIIAVSVLFCILLFYQKLCLKLGVLVVTVLTIVIIGFGQSTNTQYWQHLKSITSYYQDANIYSRLYYARASLNQLIDYPIIGSGAGTSEYSIQQYKYRFMTDLIPIHPVDGLPKIGVFYNGLGKHLHNDHLQAAIETGLLGYSLLAWAIIALFVVFFKQFRQRKHPEQIFMLGISCAVISILLNCLTDLHLQTPINAILLCFCLGMMLSYSIHKKPKQFTILKIPAQQKPFAFTITIIIIAGLFLFSAKPALAFRQYQSAIKSFKAGDVLPAISKLKNATFWENANAEYWSTEGYFWLQLADSAADASSRQYYAEQALPAIHAAIERNPVRAYYYSQLADCYMLLGKIVQQEKALRNAATYAPTDFQTLEDLTNFYILHKRFDEAKPVYQRMLTYIAQGVDENAISFGLISSLLKKLFSLLNKQNFSQSELAGYFPQNPYIFHALAGYLQSQNDTITAIKLYQQAINSYPDTYVGKINHASAYQSLANLQFAKGDTTAALASIKKAYEKNPTPENAVRHAAFIKKIGLTTEAITLARQYHQLYQDNPHLAQLANGE